MVALASSGATRRASEYGHMVKGHQKPTKQGRSQCSGAKLLLLESVVG